LKSFNSPPNTFKEDLEAKESETAKHTQKTGTNWNICLIGIELENYRMLEDPEEVKEKITEV